jgi:hypothetical protein
VRKEADNYVGGEGREERSKRAQELEYEDETAERRDKCCRIIK